MCQNIDDFNRGCALILARLYATFPIPLQFSVARIDACDDLQDEVAVRRYAERRVT
jgi:hypothetical protein